MAGYYRNFCLNFSEIAASQTIVKQKHTVVWTDDCQLAFDKVKSLLQKSPVLKSLDYEKPFKKFKEILKVSKKIFSGGKRNIGLGFKF